jgi:hypothetical protein
MQGVTAAAGAMQPLPPPAEPSYESLVLQVDEALNYYTVTAQLPGVRKEGGSSHTLGPPAGVICLPCSASSPPVGDAPPSPNPMRAFLAGEHMLHTQHPISTLSTTTH